MLDFSITYIITSFVAGLLTILAPCVLPMLPLIIGSSTGTRSVRKPATIILSLLLSIALFTLILKASTALLDIPALFWRMLSGGIIAVFGLVTLFPEIWEKIIKSNTLVRKSNLAVGTGVKNNSFWGDVLIGSALGPVFSSCSPTYATIAVTILPASYFVGLAYLAAYLTGLAVPLVLIAIMGNKVAARLGFLSNPKGWFKVSIGILFIIIGLSIIVGLDKTIESALIDLGLYDWVVDIESRLINL